MTELQGDRKRPQVETEGVGCRRLKKRIGGGNYYITVGDVKGKEFISVTIPRENDQSNHRERVIVEGYCEWLTKVGIFGTDAVGLLCQKIYDARVSQ